jgi:hypothetical protein
MLTAEAESTILLSRTVTPDDAGGQYLIGIAPIAGDYEIWWEPNFFDKVITSKHGNTRNHA